MNKRQGRAISRPAPDGATAHPTPSKWPTGHRNTGSPTSGTAALTERNIQLLIEQNAKAALEIADHAYVLEVGRVVLQGTGRELLNDPRVQPAYPGE